MRKIRKGADKSQQNYKEIAAILDHGKGCTVFAVRLSGFGLFHEFTCSGKLNAMTTTDVRLFGLGCNLSRHLHENVQIAAGELGIELKIEEVSDIQEMMDQGITAIPALQIGDQVVASGQILGVEEIKLLLKM